MPISLDELDYLERSAGLEPIPPDAPGGGVSDEELDFLLNEVPLGDVEAGREITPEDQKAFDFAVRPRDDGAQLGVTIDEVPTFAEWMEDDDGFLEGLKQGIGSTVRMIKDASAAAGDMEKQLAKIEDPERRKAVSDVLSGLVAAEGIAEGTAGFRDFGDEMLTNAGTWLLGKLGLAENQDKVADLRNYRTFVRSYVRRRDVSRDLESIAESLGVQKTKTEDGREVNPIQAGADAVSLVASPDMLAAAVVPAGPLGRVASAGLQKTGRVAARLGQSEMAAARATGRMLDVAAKTIKSPTGAAFRAAGATVTGVNKAAGAAISKLPSGIMGLGGGMAAAVATGNPWAALGGAYFFPALARARLVGSKGVGVVGDMMTGAGRIFRAPTSAQALASANMATTKGGRQVLTWAAQHKIPARVLMGAAGRSAQTVDAALQAALVNGAMGYVAAGGNMERTGQEAGAGLVVGGALAGAIQGTGALGQVLGLDTPQQKQARMDFAEEWLNSRPMGEQALLRSGRLSDDQRSMMAQASVIHGGVLSDGRPDIVEKFVTGRDFARALVADGADGLPANMSTDEKIAYLEANPPGGAAYAMEDKPMVLVNMDAHRPATRHFHELGHALQSLQFRDPNFDGDGKAQARFDQKMRRKYGDDWRPEQMTDAEKAQRNLLFGDPLNGRRQQLAESWLGEDGRYKTALPGLYAEYQTKLGREVVAKKDFSHGKTGQVLTFDDLSPTQQRKAAEMIFEELIAEKTAMLIEGAGEGNLMRHITEASKADSPAFLFGLGHYLDGYLGKLQRGLESVGITSDVFTGMRLSDEDRAVLGGMMLAKARSAEGAARRTRDVDVAIRFEDVAADIPALDANDPRLVERMASGLIDEGLYLRTGEVAPNTKKADAEFQKGQVQAVRDAFENLQVYDPQSLRYKPGSEAMSGRYLTAEQLAAVLGAPEHQMPPRVKHFLGLVNQELLANHHPANADRPAGAAVDLLYFSMRDRANGEVEGGRRAIFPLTVEVTAEGKLLTRALDMKAWEQKALKEGAPKPFKDIESFQASVIRHARGLPVPEAEAQAIRAFNDSVIRSYRFDRMAAVVPTGDLPQMPMTEGIRRMVKESRGRGNGSAGLAAGDASIIDGVRGGSLLGRLRDHGLIMAKSVAREKIRASLKQSLGDQFTEAAVQDRLTQLYPEDASGMSAAFTRDGGLMPDQAAELLGFGGDVSRLFEQLHDESGQLTDIQQGLRDERRALDDGEAALVERESVQSDRFRQARVSAAGEKVRAGDLEPGETVIVDGTEMTVLEFSDDGGVMVDGGSRFGVQELAPDDLLPVEERGGHVDVAFSPAGDTTVQLADGEKATQLPVAGGRAFVGPALFTPAFHGSRHKVSRFDLEKVGSGEGYAVYGWGLYFAESRKVAEYYKRAGDRLMSSLPAVYVRGQRVERDLTKNSKEREIAGMLDAISGMMAKGIPFEEAKQSTISFDRGMLESLRNPELAPRVSHSPDDIQGQIDATEAAIKELEGIEEGDFEVNNGHLYEVDLDVSEEALLDWDAPIGKQHPRVQEIMRGLFKEMPDSFFGMDDAWDGEHIYRELSFEWRTKGVSGEMAPRETSEQLRAAGIKGIRYKDAQSRPGGDSADSPTYNYVLFDDQAVTIEKVNDVPVTEAGAESPAGSAGMDDVAFQDGLFFDGVTHFSPGKGSVAQKTAVIPEGHPLLPPGEVDRRVLHQAVVDSFEFSPVTDRKPVMWFLGGGGGAGKSTVRALVPEVQGTVIDVDDLRPLIPEYEQKPLKERAAYTHEEVSRIGKAVFDKAVTNKADVVKDGVMGNPRTAEAQVRRARAAGFDVRLIAVTIDPATAIDRSLARARQLEETGMGRDVPIPILEKAHADFNSALASVYRSLFGPDEIRVFDNSGAEPVEISPDDPRILEHAERAKQARAEREKREAEALEREVKSAEDRRAAVLQDLLDRFQADSIEGLQAIREDARKKKDFALSDSIRDELASVGVQAGDAKL